MKIADTFLDKKNKKYYKRGDHMRNENNISTHSTREGLSKPTILSLFGGMIVFVFIAGLY